MLLSEFVMTQNLKDMHPVMASSESYSFLHHYSQNKSLPKAIQKAFGTVRNELFESETKKEIKALEAKVGLIQKVLEKPVFDTFNKENNTFYLLQSLGLTYGNGRISYMNCNKHSVQITLRKYRLPKTNRAYLSSGLINQNQKVLEMLVGETDKKTTELNATSFFLPQLLPELYNSMTAEYREKFEAQSLRAYHKSTERLHIQFEKSPVDYINLFNAKGFYFEQKKDKIYIQSIYSKYPVSIPLSVKTCAYLKSIKNMDVVLNGQSKTLNNVEEKGRAQLKNLWVSHLIEKQLYGKAAYMIVHEGVRHILHPEMMEHHLENGLRQKILEVSKQKVNFQQASILRKSVYAFSALLGGSGYKEEEVFNGFKDEFTDFSKYRSRGLFI